MAVYLVVVIFIVPFCLGLYLWRKNAPNRSVYFMCMSVSALSLVMLLLGGDVLAAIMPLGLFLASTSFFAGIYLSGLIRVSKKTD